MKKIDSELTEAILNNDLDFLERSSGLYAIDQRLADDDNDTLLLYSISLSDNNIYRFFLERGADIFAQNNEGENIIHAIVYSGSVDRIRELIKIDPKVKTLLNEGSNDGTTPLLLAVLLNKMDIFNYLLCLGIDVNTGDRENDYPIHMACHLGYYEMAVDLIKHGANLHIKTNKGNYPLALAVNGDHNKIIRYIYNYLFN